MLSLHRGLMLMLLALVGGTLGMAADYHAPRSARWPAADDIYEVPGWKVGLPQLEFGDGNQTTSVLLRRLYVDAAGDQVTFDLWANPQPEAKMLFRKGADRDFLGAGYLTQPVGSDLLAPQPGRGALIARRGSDPAWLLIYGFGEKRGMLGDGPQAWLFAEWDALLDQPNDYYLARLAIPFTSAPPIGFASTLADQVLPKIASWYARPD